MVVGRVEEASAGGVERRSEPAGLEGPCGRTKRGQHEDKSNLNTIPASDGHWKGWEKPPRSI